MISYQIIEHGKPLQKKMLETPKPQGSEVLMRVTRSGVCHSDLHIWDGYFDLGGGKRFYVKERGCVPPITLGHEPFGVVEAVGPKAPKSLIGKKRLIHPWIGCGKCAVCKAGQENYCVSGTRILGVNRAGGYSTHLLVPDAKYLIDASGIDEAFAATLACSGVTAYSASAKLPALAPSDRVAIIGCGGVGMTAVALASAATRARVVAIDPDPAKREAALAHGAALAFDPAAPEAAKTIGKACGFDIAGAIDFVGAESSSSLAVSLVRRTGQVVIVGLFGGEFRMPLPMFALKSLRITGSYVGSPADLRELVALAQRVTLPQIPLDLRPLAEVNQALGDLAAGRVVGRVVLQP